MCGKLISSWFENNCVYLMQSCQKCVGALSPPWDADVGRVIVVGCRRWTPSLDTSSGLRHAMVVKMVAGRVEEVGSQGGGVEGRLWQRRSYCGNGGGAMGQSQG